MTLHPSPLHSVNSLREEELTVEGQAASPVSAPQHDSTQLWPAAYTHCRHWHIITLLLYMIAPSFSMDSSPFCMLNSVHTVCPPSNASCIYVTWLLFTWFVVLCCYLCVYCCSFDIIVTSMYACWDGMKGCGRGYTVFIKSDLFCVNPNCCMAAGLRSTHIVHSGALRHDHCT